MKTKLIINILINIQILLRRIYTVQQRTDDKDSTFDWLMQIITNVVSLKLYTLAESMSFVARQYPKDYYT